MDKPISAIYDNGVFRPLGPVDLPDQTPVIITPKGVPGSGEGIRQSAGTWSDAGPELDEWFDKLAAMRRNNRGFLSAEEPAP